MIQITTESTTELFDAIRERVRSLRIQEWIIDDDDDLTYASAPWKNLAWMRIRKTTSGLRVNIIGNDEYDITREIYAIYHARFIEMLLTNFEELFESAEATALATKSDLI
jgi:hypothetical protein